MPYLFIYLFIANFLFLKLSQPQAREQADKEGFEVNVVKTSFKANTKALAENEGDGIAKVILFATSSSCFLHNLFSQVCTNRI
jgi:hypothetical protein